MQTKSADAAKEKQNVTELAEKDYETEVLKATLPVVVDFYSAESAPCTALAPRYVAVADNFEGRVRFLKILRQANPGLADKLKVTGSPTLIFFKGGQETGERLAGDDIKRTALKAQVEALLK